MSLKTISPAKAKKLIARGATVVDIREKGEFLREHIPGARNEPVSTLGRLAVEGDVVVYHCKSGMRTRMNAARLKAATDCEAYVLEGGIDAWKATGLPVERQAGVSDASHQLQSIGLSVVLIGVALGLSVHPAFYAVAVAAAGWLLFDLFKAKTAS